MRVDDVGRYRVVKLDLDGHLFNAIADEDAEIADDRASVVLDPAHVHIYADGRLVEGSSGGSRMMDKTWNNRAWFMVLPVLILVAFNAIIPLMTVVNYSVQETFGGNVFFFQASTWFQDVLQSERFHAALLPPAHLHLHHPRHRDPARRRDRADDAAAAASGFPSASC